MASFSTHHNWLLSLKVLLISTGVLSMAMAFKLSVPVVLDFIVSEVPSIWIFFLTWLRPPYLYILVNCIIISIVVSSKLQHHNLDHHSHSPDPLVLSPVPTLEPGFIKISSEIRSNYAVYSGASTAVLSQVQSTELEPAKISGGVRTDYAVYNGVVSNGYVYDSKVSQTVPDVQQPRISNMEKTLLSSDKITNNESNDAPSPVRTSLQRKDSLGFSLPSDDEKSPVSARFGRRKAAKAIPQGGKAALGVAKPKRQDTLGSTWKTITEGRAMPLARHLKKSDTWDTHLGRNAPLTDQNGGTHPNPRLVQKSETFSERSRTCKENNNSSASPSPGSGKLKKEPSLSQDELNRRVEAFIKKFNEEMRLQRQESLRQYQDMINRGAH